MPLKEIVIYGYLNAQEAEELRYLLRRIGVQSSKQEIPDDRIASYYQIVISEEDVKKATPTVEQFRRDLKAKVIVEKWTCPKCKSKPPLTHPKKKISLLRRIISVGTTVMECDNCGNVWYI